DPAFKLRMENRARAIDHDHVFASFDANSMCNARRNYHSDVVIAAVIVTIDKKTHYASSKTGTNVTQNHFRAALNEEHHVPLLIVVPAQLVVLRLIDKQMA